MNELNIEHRNRMKKIHLLLILPILLLMAFSISSPEKKIVFFGDSITQQGVGPNGYITLLDSMMKAAGKEAELVGAGISGNKIYDLYLRMEKDVLEKNPDDVVIYIGINDVWHKRLTGTGTDLDRFEKFYKIIITKLKEKNISVFMATPSVIGEKNDFTNPMDGDLNLYAVTVRRIAKENDCRLIDLRQSFLDYLKTNNPSNLDRGILTTDGVHLNRKGNLFVASKMLDELKDFIGK